MFPEEQRIDIPLGGGIEQRRTDHLLAPPKVSTLENLDFAEEGGYRVRDGLEQLTFSGLPAATHNSVFSYKGALWANTKSGGVFGRDAATGAGVVANASAPHPLHVITDEVLRPVEGVSDVDSAVAGNYIIVAWNPGSSETAGLFAAGAYEDVYISVFNKTDRTPVLSTVVREELGFGVKCTAFDTNKVAVVAVEANGDLNGVVVDLGASPPTIGSIVNIATGVSVPLSRRIPNFDIHGSTTKTYFNVAFWDNPGAQVVCKKVSNTLTVLVTLNKSTDMSQSLTIYHGIVQQKVYVGGSDGTNVKAFNIAEDYLSSSAVNTIFADSATVDRSKVTIVDKDGSSLWLAWSADRWTSAFTTQPNEILFSDITSGAVQTGTVGRMYGAFLAGKAFLPSGHLPHVPIRPVMFLSRQLVTGSSTTGGTTHTCLMLATPYTPVNVIPNNEQSQSSTIINTTPRLKIVAKYVQDRVFNHQEFQASASHLPSTNLLTGVRWIFGVQVYETSVLPLPTIESLREGVGIDLVEFDFNPGVLSYSTIAETLFASGGVPVVFDGSHYIESTPMTAPSVPLMSTTAGASIAKDTLYKAVWLWYDNRGNLHRSVPSLDIRVAADVATQTLKFQYPPTNLDGQNGRMLTLAVYRKTPTGSVFKLHASSKGKFIHDPLYDASGTLGYIEWTDNTATGAGDPDDASPLLYTTDGTLEAVSPPAALHSIVVAGRVFLIPGEDRETVWPSSPTVPGLTPEFNEETAIHFPDSRDELTGLGQLDDKCVVFSKNAIWFVAGNGPNAAGIGTFLVQRISSDIGCVNKNSIVSGSFGIMFEADKGIYNLTRGLELVYVGAGVEDDVKSLSILRAVVCDDRNQVRFLQQTRVLVYDYLVEQWTKFVYAFSEASMSGIDMVYHESDWYLYDSARGFAKESSSATTDLGSRIVPKLVTAWIKLDGIQNFNRIKRIQVLGSNDTTGGNIKVKLACNYDPTIYQTDQWRKTDRSTGDRLQVKVHNSRQKVESLQVTIDGSTIDATGFDLHAEYTITGLALEVALKRGLHKNIPLTDKS